MYRKSGPLLLKLCHVSLCLVILINCNGCEKLADKLIRVGIAVYSFINPNGQLKGIGLVMENLTDQDLYVTMSERVSIAGMGSAFRIPSCSRLQVDTVIVPSIERGAFYSITGDISNLAVTEQRSFYTESPSHSFELVVVSIGTKNGQQLCKYIEPSFTLTLDSDIYDTSIDIHNINNPDSIFVANGDENISVGVVSGYITEAFQYQANWHEGSNKYPDSCICPYILEPYFITTFDEIPQVNLTYRRCFIGYCNYVSTK
jgi:hypothetical protein